MANIKQISDKIADIMTQLIKDEIRAKGLVDTGALLNSIKATVSVSNNDFKISISGLDYFKYLNPENDILEDVKKKAGYNEIIELTAKLYAELALDKIKKLKK